MEAITQLLNCCATHPIATILCVASDMALWVKSDASHLTAPKARSRAADHHCLSSFPKDPTTAPDPNDPQPPGNGAISILCQITHEVISSAAEAKLAALFHNGKEACPIRITLKQKGHPQPPTPLQTDNSTAFDISNDTVKQKRSKAIDMRFCWIRDRVRQQQFCICWKKGILNKADCYFTEHHPPSHLQAIRSFLHLHDATNRSKNYLRCLQDAEGATDAPHAVHFPDLYGGEGVLIAREPGIGTEATSPGSPNGIASTGSPLQSSGHHDRDRVLSKTNPRAMHHQF
jgi:hypothetical protein